MSCTVHLFLAGFCSFAAEANRQEFDVGRFGPKPMIVHQAHLDRINQSFQPIAIHHQFFQRHLDPSPLQLAKLVVDQEIKTRSLPTIDVKTNKLAYASLQTKTRPSIDPGSIIENEKPAPPPKSKTTKEREGHSKQRRNIFAMFRKQPKIPSGVDLRKSGYRAVKIAALRHGVDVNFALSVAKQESRGNCKARSHANAKGVMQVIPGTAKKYGVRRSSKLYNCKIGADVGVRELKSCLKKARGNKPKALACYNAGPAWITSKKYRGKRLPSETRNYIKIITGKTYARVQ